MRIDKRNRAPFTVAVGSMTVGDQTSEKAMDKMLGMFLDAGHSWVDTAYIYTDGKSEQILGRLLKGSRRDKVFLATKAYPDRLGPGKPRGLTPASVREQLETSLKRLKMDGVDLFYLHAPDNKTPLEVTLAECAKLRGEGKFVELGLSNYASWQVAEIAGLCRQNGWREPKVYQGMYNAITRDIERECIVACHHFGVDFLAYNPLAGGLMTAKYAGIDRIPKSGRFAKEFYRDRFWKSEYFEAVNELAAVCRKHNLNLTEAALRWVRHHSMSDGVILGASKVEHLKQNLAACRRGRLPTPVVAAMNKAWETTRPACQRYFRD